jgi:hypothetical protein
MRFIVYSASIVEDLDSGASVCWANMPSPISEQIYPGLGLAWSYGVWLSCLSTSVYVRNLSSELWMLNVPEELAITLRNLLLLAASLLGALTLALGIDLGSEGARNRG